MSREYTNNLVESLFREEHAHAFDVGLDESLPQSPLNNFFGDIFLTLLFRCTDTLAEPLTDIKHYLLTVRSEEHTSELQSLMRISYAVFCLKKKKKTHTLKLIH